VSILQGCDQGVLQAFGKSDRLFRLNLFSDGGKPAETKTEIVLSQQVSLDQKNRTALWHPENPVFMPMRLQQG